MFAAPAGLAIPTRGRRCSAAHAATPQDDKGVVWGTYMVKVDTIAGVRATRAEMDQMWK